jgi:hypothetical protein
MWQALIGTAATTLAKREKAKAEAAQRLIFGDPQHEENLDRINLEFALAKARRSGTPADVSFVYGGGRYDPRAADTKIDTGGLGPALQALGGGLGGGGGAGGLGGLVGLGGGGGGGGGDALGSVDSALSAFDKSGAAGSGGGLGSSLDTDSPSKYSYSTTKDDDWFDPWKRRGV